MDCAVFCFLLFGVFLKLVEGKRQIWQMSNRKTQQNLVYVVARLEEGNPSQASWPRSCSPSWEYKNGCHFGNAQCGTGILCIPQSSLFFYMGTARPFLIFSCIGKDYGTNLCQWNFVKSEVCHFQIWLSQVWPSMQFAVCLLHQLARCIRFSRRLWAQGIVKPPNGRTLSLNEQRLLFLTSPALDYWTVTWVRKKKKQQLHNLKLLRFVGYLL